VCFQNRCRPY